MRFQRKEVNETMTETAKAVKDRGTAKNGGAYFIYRVSHPDFGECDIVAPGILEAVSAYAKKFRVRWADIASRCVIDQIGCREAAAESRRRNREKRKEDDG